MAAHFRGLIVLLWRGLRISGALRSQPKLGRCEHRH